MGLRAFITGLGVIAASIVFQAGSRAETPLRGPTLGVLWDAAAGGFRQIGGIPGSATLSAPIPAGMALEVVEMAPGQDYGLAVTADRSLLVVRLPDQRPEFRPVDGASGLLPRGPHRIVFSPSGASALIQGSNPASVVILTGLPEGEAVTELDLSAVPGPLTAIAISDGGGVLAGAAGGLFLIGSGADGTRLVLRAGHISAVSFLPNSLNAVAADSAANELHFLDGSSGAASKVSLPSGRQAVSSVVALAVWRDRVVAASSGAAALLDMASGEAIVLPCQCEIAGLRKLEDESVFLLNEQGPLFLLAASGAQPRIVFVPAARPDTAPGTNLAPPRARGR